MMFAILEQLRSYRADKQVFEPSPEQDFYEIASALAAGDEIDVERIDEVLNQAIKTEAELQSLIGRIEKQNQLRRQAATGPDTAALEKADRLCNSLEWELHNTTRELEAKLAQAQMERASLMSQHHVTQHAAAQLTGEILNPNLRRQFERLSAQIAEMTPAIRDASEVAQHLRRHHTYLSGAVDRKREQLKAERYDKAKRRDELSELEVELRSVTAKLEPAEAKLAELNTERDALSRRQAEIMNRHIAGE